MITQIKTCYRQIEVSYVRPALVVSFGQYQSDFHFIC